MYHTGNYTFISVFQCQVWWSCEPHKTAHQSFSLWNWPKVHHTVDHACRCI